MDIGLPDLSGLELTKIIKRSNPGIIVVAQTAYVSFSDIQDCLDSGCDDYIAKPIDQTKLFSIIDRYLKLSSQPGRHNKQRYQN